MRIVNSRTHSQRHDCEHRAHPGRTCPNLCRGLGVPVSNGVGLIECLDVPVDRAPGQGIGLVVASHQHCRVRRRAEFEREVTRGVDVQVVVTHDCHDAVRPRPRRWFVVGRQREVDAVATVAADPITARGIDRTDVVVGIGVVASPSPVAPERGVDFHEHRPARLAEQIGVECDAQRGRKHPVAVGNLPVVGDGALTV